MTPSASKPRRTIVIVEDDFLIAAGYRVVCEELGVEVLAVCDSAEEGFAAVATHEPTYALLDMHLAGDKDGVSIALAIWQNEIETSVIFATGSLDPASLDRLCHTGPYKLLMKPIDPADFENALTTAPELATHRA